MQEGKEISTRNGGPMWSWMDWGGWGVLAVEKQLPVRNSPRGELKDCGLSLSYFVFSSLLLCHLPFSLFTAKHLLTFSSPLSRHEMFCGLGVKLA